MRNREIGWGNEAVLLWELQKEARRQCVTPCPPTTTTTTTETPVTTTTTTTEPL
jgi:hypothetical protein